jgi:hypothetical protein
MKSIEIESWKHFEEIVNKHSYRKWLYRGQSNANWELESLLFRVLNQNIHLRGYKHNPKLSPRIKKETYEQEIIDAFKRSAHLYLPTTPAQEQILDWLSVMQHFGAPTRMLDFTFSPYIALFFAVIDISQEAASVYCIKYEDIVDIDQEHYDELDKKHKDIMCSEKRLSQTVLKPFEPKFTNERFS